MILSVLEDVEMNWRNGRRERLYKRYDVDDVRGVLHFKQEVRVANLSAGGMQVETDAHLAIGRRYSFRLEQEGESLEVHGLVRWCKLSGTHRESGGEVVPTYTAGVAFEQSLSPEGQALVGFLEAVTLELHHRIFGRFRVLENTSANIGEQHEFVVIRLSQSGMLIATDFAPPVESEYGLEIEFDGRPFRCDGRIAYVRQLNDEEGRVELGVEFRNVDADQHEVLKTFLVEEFAQAESDVDPR